MKKLLLLLFVIIPLLGVSQTKTMKIHGTVKDYKGGTIDKANVMLFNRSFQPIHQAISDENGQYNLEVPKGNYYGMAVINRNHYGKTKLEYWAWNIPAKENIQINPHYDKMEVYALNAFRPQGAHPSYIIYFRPMSLTKALESRKKSEKIDLAPHLEKSEINVEINKENVDIYSVQRVKEYVENKDGTPSSMSSYMIQTSLPEKFRDDYQVFRVVIKDNETGDKGEATYYLHNKHYKTQ
jgi:hypothetical protein